MHRSRTGLVELRNAPLAGSATVLPFERNNAPSHSAVVGSSGPRNRTGPCATTRPVLRSTLKVPEKLNAMVLPSRPFGRTLATVPLKAPAPKRVKLGKLIVRDCSDLETKW